MEFSVNHHPIMDGGNMTVPTQTYAPDAFFEQPHMEGEFQMARVVMADGGDRFGVSSAAFDNEQELLWMGNSGGHVTSYYRSDLQKYTSFQVHSTNEVRQILPLEDKMLALTADKLRCFTRYGRTKFDFTNEHFENMQCMLQLTPDTPSKLLIGGHQLSLLEMDLNTQQELRRIVVSEPGCAIFRRSSHFICSGEISGKISLRDPASLKVEHVLEAHSGTLSDFDIRGNQLVTCGFSTRMGTLQLDRFLMVYDLRVMRAMAPMQVMIDPMFLRFVPAFNDRLCLVSQTGQWQIVEQGAMTPAAMVMYQVQSQGAPLSCFDISTSCQSMAFGDQGGYLHLFTSCEQPVFNFNSRETDFPHTESLPPISISNQLAAYSTVPMPYPTTGKLLSDWDPAWCKRVYRKPNPIDPEILRSVKMVQNIGYAPNPGKKKRNQMPYCLDDDAMAEKKQTVSPLTMSRVDDPYQISIPKRYRRVEIKYSKLGAEEFDFRHFNKTPFVGLEPHIPNAYCNSMIQILYFCEPLRATLLSHLCQKEHCLACELGFLFHMLDTQRSKACQASNFLRAFRTVPEASALGLVLNDAEETLGKINLPRLIQSWNRFILSQLHQELIEGQKEKLYEPLVERLIRLSSQSDEASSSDKSLSTKKGEKGSKEVADEDSIQSSPMTSLFLSKIANQFRCRCGQEMSTEIQSLLFDLRYPNLFPNTAAPKEAKQYSFGDVVQQSMSLEQGTQAWCNKCEKYQPHIQTKVLQNLPDVLSLNCHLENSSDYEFWGAQENFLRPREEQTTIPNPPSNVKLCRYGTQCTRKDCKFRHITENNPVGEAPDFSKMLDELAPNSRGWVPFGLRLRLTDENVLSVKNVNPADVSGESEKDEDSKEFIEYELVATLAHARDHLHRTGGALVSHVKVGSCFHERKEKVTASNWYLFNDFLVHPIEQSEAVHFHLEWKIPCVIYYARKDLLNRHDLTVSSPITSDALLAESPLLSPRRRHVTFSPLEIDEVPKEGVVVGLDAEFVTLNQEEAEIRSDGTRSTLKPSQMSLARISCVRGSDTTCSSCEAFLDDYVSTHDEVVDYLTQFSGINPGDLDAAISNKHLNTLKSVYTKLRYLVDSGVIFVGHGLKKDFKVPRNQVIDTVDLFHLPRQRLISLKFLAWYFLGLNIQSQAHDSIEDAVTALKLYRKFEQMSGEGMDKVKWVLKEMYERGRKWQWKIPDPPEISPALA